MATARNRDAHLSCDDIVERYGFRLLRRPGVFSVRSNRDHVLVEVDNPAKRRGELPSMIGKVRVRVVRGSKATAAARTG